MSATWFRRVTLGLRNSWLVCSETAFALYDIVLFSSISVALLLVKSVYNKKSELEY